MFNSILFQQLLMSLAILTSMGTLVQDNRLNKALELTAPLSDFSVNVSSHLDGLNEAASAHSHVEQTAVTQNLVGMPRIQARDDHRRYYSPKTVSRNSTPFGDSQIFDPSS